MHLKSIVALAVILVSASVISIVGAGSMTFIYKLQFYPNLNPFLIILTPSNYPSIVVVKVSVFSIANYTNPSFSTV
jgi:hypothetical protein